MCACIGLESKAVTGGRLLNQGQLLVASHDKPLYYTFNDMIGRTIAGERDRATMDIGLYCLTVSPVYLRVSNSHTRTGFLRP
jgi:hypothetical protein